MSSCVQIVYGEMTIRRLNKIRLKKMDFPRIADSWNFSGLRIFGFGFWILAIFLKIF